MTYKKSDLRKIFSFSTEESAAVISTYLHDASALSGQPESSIIESLLLAEILPKNRTAAYYVQELLQHADDPGALCRAYNRIMALYAAGGADWSAKYSNGRPIVDLLREEMLFYSGEITGAEREWLHLNTQWDSIVQLVDQQPAENDHAKWEHDNAVRFGHELQRQIATETSREPALVNDCVTYICQNWIALGNHTRTYRALCDLVNLAQIKNTARGRIAYIRTISTIAAAWLQEGGCP